MATSVERTLIPTTAQLLKGSGNLTGITLDDLPGVEAALGDLEFVTQNNFCGHPHLVDDEIINADDGTLAKALDLPERECSGIKLAMERMKAAATGIGSYPAGCNTAYAGLHSVAYYDTEARPPHLMRVLTDAEWQGVIDAGVWGPSGDPTERPFTLAELKAAWGERALGDVVNIFAEECYRRVGVIMYEVKTGPDGQHNIHVSYPVLRGGTIGLGWFPGADPCPGDHVDLHIDKTYTAGFQGQLGLKIHEFGHTLQAPHQFTSQGSHQEPMSYRYGDHLVVGYSTGDPVFRLPRSPSMKLWERLYGGVPVGTPWKGQFEGVTPPDSPELPNSGPNGVYAVDGKLFKIWVEEA